MTKLTYSICLRARMVEWSLSCKGSSWFNSHSLNGLSKVSFSLLNMSSAFSTQNETIWFLKSVPPYTSPVSTLNKYSWLGIWYNTPLKAQFWSAGAGSGCGISSLFRMFFTYSPIAAAFLLSLIIKILAYLFNFAFSDADSSCRGCFGGGGGGRKLESLHSSGRHSTAFTNRSLLKNLYSLKRHCFLRMGTVSSYDRNSAVALQNKKKNYNLVQSTPIFVNCIRILYNLCQFSLTASGSCTI